MSETTLRRVAWMNIHNWRAIDRDGAGTRVHLTEEAGSSGKTLCGKEFPAAKGYPSNFKFCRKCFAKAGRPAKELIGLEYVPSEES